MLMMVPLYSKKLNKKKNIVIAGRNIKEGYFYASYKLLNFSNSLETVAETKCYKTSKETTSTERICKGKLMDRSRSL